MRGAPENEHPQALMQQPVESLADEIADYIERLRPQVIITHDPYGGYGHPDHIQVCEAVTAAFERTAASSLAYEPCNQPQKLYYTAYDKRLLRLSVKLMPLFGKDPTAFGRNRDINFVEIAGWDTPVNARVPIAPYLAQRQAASEAHASQYSGGPSFMRIIPAPMRKRMASYDTFTRAVPAPNGRIESDIFAGVESCEA